MSTHTFATTFLFFGDMLTFDLWHDLLGGNLFKAANPVGANNPYRNTIRIRQLFFLHTLEILINHIPQNNHKTAT